MNDQRPSSVPTSHIYMNTLRYVIYLYFLCLVNVVTASELTVLIARALAFFAQELWRIE